MSTHFLRRRSSLPLLACVVVSVVHASTAAAQFGALRKAAERRAEQKVSQTAEDQRAVASLIPPVFDATMVELTDARLDRGTAAMERNQVTRASNRQRYDALQAEISTLRETAERTYNPKERDAYDKSYDRYVECRQGVVTAMEEASEQQMEALQQRIMTNPAAAQRDPKMKELMAALQAMALAQQSGDTAAINRATARAIAFGGVATDSAAIDRKAVAKCGARPAKPRSMVVSDSLEKLASSKMSEANTLVGPIPCPKGGDVDVTDRQAAMICERIRSWLNGMQDSAPITRTFTRAEYDRLVARRKALRKAYMNAE